MQQKRKLKTSSFRPQPPSCRAGQHEFHTPNRTTSTDMKIVIVRHHPSGKRIMSLSRPWFISSSSSSSLTQFQNLQPYHVGSCQTRVAAQLVDAHSLAFGIHRRDRCLQPKQSLWLMSWAGLSWVLRELHGKSFESLSSDQYSVT